MRVIGGRGEEPGQFSYPYGVCFLRDEQVISQETSKPNLKTQFLYLYGVFFLRDEQVKPADFKISVSGQQMRF